MEYLKGYLKKEDLNPPNNYLKQGDEIYLGTELNIKPPNTKYKISSITINDNNTTKNKISFENNTFGTNNNSIKDCDNDDNDSFCIIIDGLNKYLYITNNRLKRYFLYSEKKENDILPVTGPVIRPGPVTAPMTGPGPVTAPVTAPMTGPGPVTEPVTASITESVTEPVTAPMTGPGPVTAPVTAPMTGPVTEPVTASMTGPVTEPVTASITGPVTASITGPVTTSIADSESGSGSGYIESNSESNPNIKSDCNEAINKRKNIWVKWWMTYINYQHYEKLPNKDSNELLRLKNKVIEYEKEFIKILDTDKLIFDILKKSIIDAITKFNNKEKSEKDKKKRILKNLNNSSLNRNEYIKTVLKNIIRDKGINEKKSEDITKLEDITDCKLFDEPDFSYDIGYKLLNENVQFMDPHGEIITENGQIISNPFLPILILKAICRFNTVSTDELIKQSQMFKSPFNTKYEYIKYSSEERINIILSVLNSILDMKNLSDISSGPLTRPFKKGGKKSRKNKTSKRN